MSKGIYTTRILGGLLTLAASCLATAGDFHPQAHTQARLRCALLVDAADRPEASLAERELVERLAAQLGMQVAWQPTRVRLALRQALESGIVDMVIDPLYYDHEVALDTPHSVDLAAEEYFLLGLPRDAVPANTSGLADITVALAADHPALPLMDLLRTTPEASFELAPVSKRTVPADLAAGLASRRYDAVLGTRKELAALRVHLPAVEPWFSLTPGRAHNWKFALGREALATAADQFLLANSARVSSAESIQVGLTEIRQRRMLRVGVLAGSDGYFLRKGDHAGFDYELAKAFAGHLDVAVDLRVSDRPEQLVEWLQDGVVDLVATALTPDLYGDSLVATRRYHYVAPVLVTAPKFKRVNYGMPGILLVSELVPMAMLDDLRQLDLLVTTVPDGDIGRRLQDPDVEAAIVPADRIPKLRTQVQGLEVASTVGNQTSHRWLVRTRDGDLLEAAETFLDDGFRTSTYNILARRYAKVVPKATAASGISPYDEIVRAAALRHGFDWRLVLAQMYEESRFDPTSESDKGAKGLMQILPTTVADLGEYDLDDPHDNIDVGTAYLASLRDRFIDDVAVSEQAWFALAAYHAGYTRVSKARLRAAEAGLDPDRWFDNVELMLNQHSRAQLEADDPDIVCRCGATGRYVRAVRSRYQTYRLHTQEEMVAGLPRVVREKDI